MFQAQFAASQAGSYLLVQSFARSVKIQVVWNVMECSMFEKRTDLEVSIVSICFNDHSVNISQVRQAWWTEADQWYPCRSSCTQRILRSVLNGEGVLTARTDGTVYFAKATSVAYKTLGWCLVKFWCIAHHQTGAWHGWDSWTAQDQLGLGEGDQLVQSRSGSTPKMT